MAAPTPEIRVHRTAADMPTAEEVERLYAAASAPPPLAEPPSVAGMFARLYRQAREIPGAVAVAARRDIGTDGTEPNGAEPNGAEPNGAELVGFSYGHPWHWSTQSDPWSAELARRLGDAAAALDGSLAVELLAVAPECTGAGIGRLLLATLLDAADPAVAWLQTTDLDTPARRLYLRTGWRLLGSGPAAPNGEPGLVLVWHRSAG